jgi:hypothetical protein
VCCHESFIVYCSLFFVIQQGYDKEGRFGGDHDPGSPVFWEEGRLVRMGVEVSGAG